MYPACIFCKLISIQSRLGVINARFGTKSVGKKNNVNVLLDLFMGFSPEIPYNCDFYNEFGPKRAPNRLDADINSKKTHATYMLIGYQAIFTHYWIYLGDFLQRYIKIVLFTPGFDPKRSINDP